MTENKEILDPSFCVTFLSVHEVNKDVKITTCGLKIALTKLIFLVDIFSIRISIVKISRIGLHSLLHSGEKKFFFQKLISPTDYLNEPTILTLMS